MIADSQWRPASEKPPSEDGVGDGDGEHDGESCRSIERCTAEDWGWMKIATMMIDAFFYDIPSGLAFGGWKVYYDRPPAIVFY